MPSREEKSAGGAIAFLERGAIRAQLRALKRIDPVDGACCRQLAFEHRVGNADLRTLQGEVVRLTRLAHNPSDLPAKAIKDIIGSGRISEKRFLIR